MNVIKRIIHYIFLPFSVSENEIKPLHGLRALSALGIIVFHVGNSSIQLIDSSPELLRNFISNLNSGVDLFFVLSGYLITTGLLKNWQHNQKIDFITFYIKRNLRIFPSYYLILAIMIVVFWFQIKVGSSIESPTENQLRDLAILKELYKNRFYDLFYVSNFVEKRILIQGWSLSIEEQYYLIFPLLCSFLLFKLNRKHRMVALVLLYCIPLFFRLYYLLIPNIENKDFAILSFTQSRFDGLIIGVIIATWFHDWPEQSKQFLDQHIEKITLASLILFLISHSMKFGINPILTISWFNIIQLSFGGFVITGIYNKNWLAKVLSIKPLIPVAKFSYNIYLWHMLLMAPAFKAFYRLNEPMTYSKMVFIILTTMVLSFLIAWLVYIFVEGPFMILRERLLHRIRMSRLQKIEPK